MSTLFYDHLIPWEKVQVTLNGIDATVEEKAIILDHIEEIIHTHMLMYMLERLPQEKHESFIIRFHENPSDITHIGFLREHGTKDIEKEIQDAIQKTVENLLSDLK
ncbi:hypothetical protein C5B42_01745 [Candidatus Cerribacteria bacterium 'Amazon FNV 2010 28 9']|uniref:Uncharacterized protein n=1 Tax=Candidatus Cerribacteria bacterium 'Amazon FNV 2010 28 9' TaxID=2081795 RepID=A0A317JPQ7_9BACT|nr:MAG: hypothetical protein C5B42_01745 [Candidatus Cerribacteria bacterium 'Amazon FNV 2010 28 9']